MNGELEKIEKEFDKIKDHKPKATKKLKLLGNLLSSAYKIDPNKANEMWDYIIKLNVDDKGANAKFYAAQVFNKIIRNLSDVDATNFISMDPKRVQLLIFHGYTGSTIWSGFNTLITGYLKQNQEEDAFICIQLFMKKFSSADENGKWMIELSANVFNICFALIQTNVSKDNCFSLLNEMENVADENVSPFVTAMKVLNDFEEVDNFEPLLNVLIKYKNPGDFINMLLKASDKCPREYLAEKLEIFLDSYKSEHGPVLYYIDNLANLKFYNDLFNSSNKLLNILFSDFCSMNRDLYTYIVYQWLKNGETDKFIEYVSKALMNLSEMDFSSFTGIFDDFFRAANAHSGLTYYLYSGTAESFNDIMKNNQETFVDCLIKVLISATGTPSYENFYLYLNNMFKKIYGNAEIFNKYNLTSSSNISITDKLHDITKKFVLDEKMETVAGFRSKINIIKTGEKGLNENEKIDYYYELAKDPYISKYFFKLCPTSSINIKKDLMKATLVKEDFTKLNEFIEMMIETVNYPDYNDLNGRSFQNERAVQFLIGEINFEMKYDRIDISANSINNLIHLANKICQYFPSDLQNDLKDTIRMTDSLKLIDTDSESRDEYINEVIELADKYIKKDYKGAEVNHISSRLLKSLEILSNYHRIDVIIHIMKKFVENIDQCEPVVYASFYDDMLSHVSSNEFVEIFRNAPEILDGILVPNSEFDTRFIKQSYEKIHKCGNDSDLNNFLQLVKAKMGNTNMLENKN